MGSSVTNDSLCYSRSDIATLLDITTPFAVSNIPLGSVALASIATSAVHVAGSLYTTSIFVPKQLLVTNINVLQGATASTDNLLGFIYSASGALVITSVLAGVLQASASTFLPLPLIAPTIIPAGLYYTGIQSNGTTGTTQRIPASTYGLYLRSQLPTGAFGTVPATMAAVPTTFTAAQAPVIYFN